MAKVKVNIKPLIKEINRTFDKVINDKQLLGELGTFTTKRIQAEIRRSKPLNDTRKFPALKDLSIKIRKHLERFNFTDIVYKANRSNLTFTGQLVEAIKFKIIKGNVVEIAVANTKRQPIAGAKGLIPDKKTNLEVSRDLKKLGFFLFTAKGLDSEPKIDKRLKRIVKKFVRRAIKLNFGS